MKTIQRSLWIIMFGIFTQALYAGKKTNQRNYANKMGQSLTYKGNIEHLQRFVACGSARDFDLRGFNLAHIIAKIRTQRGKEFKFIFAGTRLNNAILSTPHHPTNLSRSDFQNSVLNNVSLRNCDLRESNFTGAQVRHCDFTNADLHKICAYRSTLFQVLMPIESKKTRDTFGNYGGKNINTIIHEPLLTSKL